MADTARTTSQDTTMSSTIDHNPATTAAQTSHEEHNPTRDVFMGNCGDRTSTQPTRLSTPSSTSTLSSASAQDYASTALAKSEVVIYSWADSNFTYMTENQLRDSIVKGKRWTQGLTWTRPRISSNTFEVEVQWCAEYIDDDGPPLCVRKFREGYEIDMPYKVWFSRNVPPKVRKFEKIFISREPPELYW